MYVSYGIKYVKEKVIFDLYTYMWMLQCYGHGYNIYKLINIFVTMCDIINSSSCNFSLRNKLKNNYPKLHEDVSVVFQYLSWTPKP